MTVWNHLLTYVLLLKVVVDVTVLVVVFAWMVRVDVVVGDEVRVVVTVRCGL